MIKNTILCTLTVFLYVDRIKFFLHYFITESIVPCENNTVTIARDSELLPSQGFQVAGIRMGEGREEWMKEEKNRNTRA